MNRAGIWIALAGAVAASGLLTPGAVAAVEESDGRIDRTFATGGIMRAAFDTGESPRDVANAVIVRTDGRILVGGRVRDGDDQFALARYRRNGELDREFAGPAGWRATDVSTRDGGEDSIADLAIQPDGGIVAAGYATAAEGGRDFAVARYDSEGEFDPGFGIGGVATASAGPGNVVGDDQAVALALQPNGEIVLAGSTAGAGGDDSAIARFNPNGSLDPSFSGDGLLRSELGPGVADGFTDVEVGAGGAITAVGSISRPDDTSRPDVLLSRFRPDGSPDPSLGGDGSVEIDLFGGGEAPTSLAPRPGGGLLVAGTSSGPGLCDAFTLIALTAGGALDAGFGRGGVAWVDLNPECGEEANAMAVQPNGKILVGGGNGEGAFALTRFTPAGFLDPSMGGDGIVVRPVDSGGQRPADTGSAIVDLAVGRAGSVVVVGSSRAAADSSVWTMARFSNPCSLAAAAARGTATRFGKAHGRLRRARKELREARRRLRGPGGESTARRKAARRAAAAVRFHRRAEGRAKGRMKVALRAAKRACDV